MDSDRLNIKEGIKSLNEKLDSLFKGTTNHIFLIAYGNFEKYKTIECYHC